MTCQLSCFENECHLIISSIQKIFATIVPLISLFMPLNLTSSVFFPLSAFISLCCPFQTFLGLFEADALYSCRPLLISFSSTNVPLSFSLFPSPSTSASHSAILKTSLATSSIYDFAVAAPSTVVLIHLNKHFPQFFIFLSDLEAVKH